MKSSSIILTIAVIFTSGCATNYGVASSADVAKAVIVENSSFDSVATYTGPQVISETRRGLFTDNQTVRLVATKNKTTEKITYFIYTKIIYSFDWRFYNSVSFRDGVQDEVKPISQQTNGCQTMGCLHTEEVIFQVEKNSILGNGDFEFRLNSRNGTQNTMKIPQSYISGFFKGLPSEFQN